MRSIDANIPLRVLLEDDPFQEEIAREVLQTPCLLLPTVVFEIVYVLQSQKWTRADIADGLEALLCLDTLIIREDDALRWAIARYREAGEFADLLNVALSRDALSFVTFDQRIEKFANGGPVPVETLPNGQSRNS